MQYGFPGQYVCFDKAQELLANGEAGDYCGTAVGPIKNYFRDDISKLPNLIVYIHSCDMYFLMTPEQFLSKDVQFEVSEQRRKYYGALVSDERVGC